LSPLTTRRVTVEVFDHTGFHDVLLN
jgi:hypothetical protein